MHTYTYIYIYIYITREMLKVAEIIVNGMLHGALNTCSWCPNPS